LEGGTDDVITELVAGIVAEYVHRHRASELTLVTVVLQAPIAGRVGA
jgi:hypothetical protein